MAFDLFGGSDGCEPLRFALRLQSQLGLAGSLCGEFRLARLFGGFTLGDPSLTGFVHRGPRSLLFGARGILG